MVALPITGLHSNIYTFSQPSNFIRSSANRGVWSKLRFSCSEVHHVRASFKEEKRTASAFSQRCRNRYNITEIAASSTVMASSSEATVGAQGQSGSKDLLIVGPGVLGSFAGKLWLESFPDATVIGQTNTTTNHDQLRSMGIQPRTKDQAGTTRYPFVLFAAPPSGSEDYVAEIAAAAKLWDGTGSMLFTSSAGIYAEDDGGPVNEDSPISAAGSGERNDRLINGEIAATDAGGNVVRLVGLYHSLRGAHTFFLRMGEVPRWGGYTINLIHYEDAASLCVAILRGDGTEGSQYRSKTFLGTDGAPVTMEAMMEAVYSSGAYEGQAKMTGQPGGKGKLANNGATREALSWSPQWNSFGEFMAAGAQDWYRANVKPAVPVKA